MKAVVIISPGRRFSTKELIEKISANVAVTQEDDILGIDEIEARNTPIEEIDSDVVNLISFHMDSSGSMDTYIADVVSALKEFKAAIVGSKEAEEILVSRSNFGGFGVQIGGHKKADELDISYVASGGTPMYDCIISSADELLKYKEVIERNGGRVKAVFATFSDGADNSSKHNIAEAKATIEKLNKLEIVTAFIEFGPGAANIATNLGYKNKLTAGSSASEIRRVFNYLSKSVIENSKSVVGKGNTDTFFI